MPSAAVEVFIIYIYDAKINCKLAFINMHNCTTVNISLVTQEVPTFIHDKGQSTATDKSQIYKTRKEAI